MTKAADVEGAAFVFLWGDGEYLPLNI